MKTQLETNRDFILHPGSKGDSSENNWIKWLNTYLPNRYKAEKAFVIDYKGNLSEQMDVVIYDPQYSLFVFNQDDMIYIPAESVYAVFEVKQNLNKAHVEYAGKKIKSVRELERTSAPIYYAKGQYPPKPLFNIIGGILTLTNDWKALDEPFNAAIKSCKDNEKINLGCCIDAGSFAISYTNEKITYDKSNKEDALIFFFLNLIEMLQKLGTVSAIEITKYRQNIDSTNHEIK
jgi:hypothetical protein